MSNEYPVLQYLTSKSKKILGFKSGDFKFNGGDFHRLFKIRQKEIIEGKAILSQQENLEYMKCYAVAVGSVINKWYRKPDYKPEEDFQSQFFYEGIAYLKKYYEQKPYKRYFKEFTHPPKNETEEKSRANWLIRKAEQFMMNISDDFLRDLYEARCIDYDAYKEAKKEYNFAVSKGIYNDPVEPEDFHYEDCLKESLKDFNLLLEESIADIEDKEYFDQIDQFLERINENQVVSPSINPDELVNRLRLSHSTRIRQLYSIFSVNDVEEISSTAMWEVKHSELKLEQIEMIFKAMDYGYPLSLEGKQFLLMQYLCIAIGELRHYEGFSISNSRVTVHTDKQMIFLATVIGQTYTYFNNKYAEKIIKPLSKIPIRNKKEEERIATTRKEKLFTILSDFIRDNIHTRFQDYQAQKSQLTLKMINAEIPALGIDASIELESVFQSFENFDRFIHKLILQQSVPSLFDIEDFILKFGAKASTKDIKNILKAILSSLGYEVQENGETENRFLYKGSFGRFKNQNEVAINSPNKDTVSAMYIVEDECLSFNKVLDINQEMKQAGTKFTTIISTKGFEDASIDKDDKSRDAHTYQWTQKVDLLKLAALIKEYYHQLPDSEKNRVQNLIEVLIADF